MSLLAEASASMRSFRVVHAEWLPMLPTADYRAVAKILLAATLLTFICAAAQGFAKEAIDE
ncbi:hypothetical protein ACGFJT_37210 [Actinomadura geliboluensis]|uniref:hypothetical protein n=1 Tax=Actinomadura geliboluensis TaxID=882440 RepID=UPI003722FE06